MHVVSGRASIEQESSEARRQTKPKKKKKKAERKKKENDTIRSEISVEIASPKCPKRRKGRGQHDKASTRAYCLQQYDESSGRIRCVRRDYHHRIYIQRMSSRPGKERDRIRIVHLIWNRIGIWGMQLTIRVLRFPPPAPPLPLPLLLPLPPHPHTFARRSIRIKQALPTSPTRPRPIQGRATDWHGWPSRGRYVVVGASRRM